MVRDVLLGSLGVDAIAVDQKSSKGSICKQTNVCIKQRTTLLSVIDGSNTRTNIVDGFITSSPEWTLGYLRY